MNRLNRSVTLLLASTALTLTAAALSCAQASDCGAVTLEQGRVVQVIDARTLRLADGREIRLDGIEIPSVDAAAAMGALAALTKDRDVTLRADGDAPDRYGRQRAFVFPMSDETSVQVTLLRGGQGLTSGMVPMKPCAAELAAAEMSARRARQGRWNKPEAVISGQKPEDILAKLGQFAVVEGRVVSARQAGATFYLNFGRHWIRDFAVIIPRQMVKSFATDGIDLTGLKGRRIRVRGWIERRNGPRIEVASTGQLDLLDSPRLLAPPAQSPSQNGTDGDLQNAGPTKQ